MNKWIQKINMKYAKMWNLKIITILFYIVKMTDFVYFLTNLFFNIIFFL